MKLNIANPTTGLQKCIEIDDDKKLAGLYDKRLAAEISGEQLSPEYKGYIFKIKGGNDKQGFPMMQGVLCNHRVRLLFRKGMKCFRPRRTGQMKKKSVRGCIVGPDISVLHMTLVKKGESEIEGLTDDIKPRRLGPKRVGKIVKLFGLSKEDDVRKFVIRRDTGKKKKAPKIQRLVTPITLQRRKVLFNKMVTKIKATREKRAKYAIRLAEYHFELKQAAHHHHKPTSPKQSPIPPPPPPPPVVSKATTITTTKKITSTAPTQVVKKDLGKKTTPPPPPPSTKLKNAPNPKHASTPPTKVTPTTPPPSKPTTSNKASHPPPAAVKVAPKKKK